QRRAQQAADLTLIFYNQNTIWGHMLPEKIIPPTSKLPNDPASIPGHVAFQYDAVPLDSRVGDRDG
ncbi:MAG: hypothetical protein NTV38_14030, partial [Chloroflexi bacterium]|nr:hypothetical protein [Chloroflexota bacterium]